ncbi:hypothetical protein SAMN05660748_0054 [Blastococcus aggregatus]|uniref:Uncharacterized protein n=1 Tax=Blastococcus aggregatus TaxID=38502 RepID=A0A285V0R1_9ACTN|nr:hypothetical protein [Blastococcus aggregatus]SOC46111.1 hypothetical protein SAMN05660748_0054 [Blastococcus aggregatus]
MTVRQGAAAVRVAPTVVLVAVGLIVLTAGPATAGPVELTAAVCPEAPPGVEAFADQVTAWVKWGVLALIGIAAVVSLGSVLVGRMFSHPHASRYGAMGIAVVVMVAITYTVILVILGSITGSGCT